MSSPLSPKNQLINENTTYAALITAAALPDEAAMITQPEIFRRAAQSSS